ncbi:hypothetical protein EJ04DRAFT_528699 [Polyplosphaeria fusca]|uniref:Uncharacterized protein n=1 Tax=Polyplosphaeria fusca TaxID=682080 RepID=A0A9P4QJD5_9PLEO|nr:hypothetical protein EJ04DRAFT_528699 [Polyplosphaeria fusca]
MNIGLKDLYMPTVAYTDRPGSQPRTIEWTSGKGAVHLPHFSWASSLSMCAAPSVVGGQVHSAEFSSTSDGSLLSYTNEFSISACILLPGQWVLRSSSFKMVQRKECHDYAWTSPKRSYLFDILRTRKYQRRLEDLEPRLYARVFGAMAEIEQDECVVPSLDSPDTLLHCWLHNATLREPYPQACVHGHTLEKMEKNKAQTVRGAEEGGGASVADRGRRTFLLHSLQYQELLPSVSLSHTLALYICSAFYRPPAECFGESIQNRALLRESLDTDVPREASPAVDAEPAKLSVELVPETLYQSLPGVSLTQYEADDRDSGYINSDVVYC